MKQEDNFDNVDELDEDADIVVFVDENGNKHEFEVIDEIIENGIQYLAMVSAEGLEENENSDELVDELVIAKVVEKNGKETLLLLEDEEEFETISKLFTEHLSEYFDIVDDDCCCEDDCDNCSNCEDKAY